MKNYLLGILGGLIATGFLFGYRKWNGPINKKTPWIIGISSILIMMVVTLVIIPLVSLTHENFPSTLEKLNILYQNSEYMAAIFKDPIVSIIFTILGIDGVISKIKQEIA